MGKCILLKSGSGGIDPDELTATKEDILINKLAGVKGNDEPVSGSMPNRGAVTQSLNCGNSYTIPSGYHNGSGKVTANSLSSQTSANATSGQILSGQTAWVNGSKITGSMSNRGAVSQGLGINGSYTIPAGYHNGNGKVTQSIPVQGGSTTTPGTANKTIVAANRYVNGNIIVAGSSNLTAGNIKKGVNIFGVVGTWEGYVVTATDLYNRGVQGNLGGGFAAQGNIIFDAGQITWPLVKGTRRYIYTKSTINMTGYKTLKLECDMSGHGNTENVPRISMMVSREQNDTSVLASVFSPATSFNASFTQLTCDVTNVNAYAYVIIQQSPATVVSWSGAMYRVTLS